MRLRDTHSGYNTYSCSSHTHSPRLLQEDLPIDVEYERSRDHAIGNLLHRFRNLSSSCCSRMQLSHPLRTRKGDAAHLVLRLITWKHVPAGQFLGRLGMTINYYKPHLIANTMSCVLFDPRDSSAAFRLSPARGVAMTSMPRIKNAADSS